MRRKDRQREEAFALELLKNCEYAVLSTVDGSKVPYGVPISPVLEGRTVYFHCALEGKKLQNISANTQVCLTCIGETQLLPEEFTTRYQSAVAFGTAEMVEDKEEKIHALRLICEKYAAENMEAFEDAIERSLKQTGVCRIALQEITGKERR